MNKTMGYMNKVVNKGRKTGENTAYYVVKLEDQSGKNEFWCVFTEKEVSRITPATVEDDKPHKLGRLYYRHTVGNMTRSFLSFMMYKHASGEFATYTRINAVITDALIKKGRDRAARNLEDIPKQSWLSNFID